MKILHTADWHLGQKFIVHDREEESRLVLKWLLETIHTEAVDLLIVAGDIFDISNPPHYARTLYYDFLKGLLSTGCRHVVITGGNHDSPAMLNAPRGLLQSFQIHVAGCTSEEPQQDVIELYSRDGKLEAVVVAVPFLRDRDLRFAGVFETGEMRLQQIKEGILNHYNLMAGQVEKYVSENIPVLVTGHLYAKGAVAGEGQNNIYLGNMDNIDATALPAIFDYVALGHLHKAQPVGGMRHIRYSGSLMPLSFSEVNDKKAVTILEFKGKLLDEIRNLPVPVFRRLVSLEGDLQKVQDGLLKLDAELKAAETDLKAWVEINLYLENAIPGIEMSLDDFTKDMFLEILKRKVFINAQSQVYETVAVNLNELTPEEVFEKRCAVEGLNETDAAAMKQLFIALQTWMKEQEAI